MADVEQINIVSGIPTTGTGTVDTLIVTNALLRELVGAEEYLTVAISQTDFTLNGGSGGAQGDYITRLICTVATAATGAVSIKDGAGSSIPLLPNSPGGGVGVYEINLGITSIAGAWKVTTGAGVTVLAIGEFT
jgi:hypothetical protein